MNHLTPLSIRRQEFKRNIRGFDTDEVNAFLNIVANEFEELLKNNEELNSSFSELQKKLAGYQQIEKGLQQTLLTAQEQTNRSVESSKKQANLIVKEAELKAKAIIDQAKAEAKYVLDSVSELKNERDTLIHKIRAIVNAQMQLLDSMTYSKEKIREENIDHEKKSKIDSIIGKLL